MSVQTVDVQARVQELTAAIINASANDPTKAQELTRELSKLLRSNQEQLAAKVQETRVTHQGEIEGVVEAAREQIAEYAKSNNLAAFTVSMGFGYADEKMNGRTFNWAGRSIRAKRRGAGGGRKQPGILKLNGQTIGAFDSATAAVRQLASEGVKGKDGQLINIPLHAVSQKPTRNASLVLADAGYVWEKTGK